METLIRSRNKGLSIDNDDNWKKLIGDTKPGNLIQIIWKDWGDMYTDKGYLFAAPECCPDEGDIFVHIPKPQNPYGKDDARGESGTVDFAREGVS